MDIPSPASSNDALAQTPPSLLFAASTSQSTSGRSAPGAGLHRSATQPIPATSHPIGGSLGRAQTQRSQIWNQQPQSRSQIYNLSGSAHNSGTFPSSSSSALERSLSNNTNYHSISASPSSSSTFLNTSSSPHLSTSSKSLATIEVRGISRDFDNASTVSPTSSDRNLYSQGGMNSPLPGTTSFGRDRENSIGGEDVWASLCVRVLPLFNGEGVKGALEDLNDLLRHCLTDPISPTLYSDIEGLLRDGMLTLNGKLYGVSDDKLVSRLVEQWSFFFGNVLPYIEGVFLPLRTDVRWRNIEEEDFWNVRTIALKNFRDCVILPMIDRLEEVFAKLFLDFVDSDKNPAETAARMLQMTSILASIPNDRNIDIERVSNKLKANCKKFMNKRDRRGFVGIQELRKPTEKPGGKIFSPMP